MFQPDINARKRPMIISETNKLGHPGSGFRGHDATGESIGEQNIKMLSRLQQVSGNVAYHMEMPKAAGLKHVKINWKKKQQQEEKSTEIERENRILLEKMRRIYKKPGNNQGNGGR